ncbi:aminopeptidase P family protein [Paracoccaceae bacterium GXU_MW_L88]
MFQRFDDRSNPANVGPRLSALREEMEGLGLDGFLIPRGDAHQGENVAERDERLAYVTGFTGSAGLAIVTQGDAILFVDGRYTLQAPKQSDPDLVTFGKLGQCKPSDWLSEHLPDGGVVGFDPWLHVLSEVRGLGKALEAHDIKLMPVRNPVDMIWDDQPAAPVTPLRIQPQDLAGLSHQEKRETIGSQLEEDGIDAVLLTQPDSIAWLLNIRGGDIPRTPVALCFAILHSSGRVELFIDEGKLTPEIDAHLGSDVAPARPSELVAALSQLKGKVQIDPDLTPYKLAQAIDAETVEAGDPCIAMKARKTEAELDGARAAHKRDGVAMVRFLHWLDTALEAGDEVTEIKLVEVLEGFRRESNTLQDISFETISGIGPNGAIVHYRVTESSNRSLTPGEVILIDSGGQYPDGTTDITRTLATGETDAEAKDAFTRVLLGMIDLTQARFPDGVTGRDLDAIARMPLWQIGKDYAHGTGHGVGAFLGVHEGPQSIARSPRGAVKLEPGMILSNEPGYYEEGRFGIRIENLIAIHKAEDGFMEFETLTLCPIDRKMIAPEILPQSAKDWLNAYHQQVFDALSPDLGEAETGWLRTACAPL